MSKITTIYDGIFTEIATLFPNKIRLWDSYDLATNPNSALTNGYGVKVGPGTAPEEEFNQVFQEKTFIITFTKDLIKNKGDTAKTDIKVKELLEDIKTIQNDFCQAVQLGISSSIDSVQVGQTSAIEFLAGEQGEFIFIEQDFTISYTEDL